MFNLLLILLVKNNKLVVVGIRLICESGFFCKPRATHT